jgi:hypothetical protein
MNLDSNPYAPPHITTTNRRDDRDAAWHLHHVQKYYRRMGLVGLSYVGLLVIATAASQAIDEQLKIANIFGIAAWCSLLAWLFVTMIRIGNIPHADFPSHYTKARWAGIVAGAMFLPILGLPALISVRRLTRYHELIHVKSREELGETLLPADSIAGSNAHVSIESR